jgi:hypothetical protein
VRVAGRGATSLAALDPDGAADPLSPFDLSSLQLRVVSPTRYCVRCSLQDKTQRYNSAFFKRWSADHKWSSGSALVVLGLTFYEINYSPYTDLLL